MSENVRQARFVRNTGLSVIERVRPLSSAGLDQDFHYSLQEPHRPKDLAGLNEAAPSFVARIILSFSRLSSLSQAPYVRDRAVARRLRAVHHGLKTGFDVGAVPTNALSFRFCGQVEWM